MSFLGDESIFDGDDEDVFAKGDKPSGEAHIEIMGPGGKKVPGYLRDALERFIRENPDAAQNMYQGPDGINIPYAVTMMSELTKPLAVTQNANQNSTTRRALVTVLDRWTEGEVTRLARVFDAEHLLISLHNNLALLNQLHLSLTTSDVPSSDAADMIVRFITTHMNILAFSIDKTVEEYLIACELADYEPSDKVIEEGLLAEGTLAEEGTFALPCVDFHYLFGDVTGVAASRQAFIDELGAHFSHIDFDKRSKEQDKDS